MRRGIALLVVVVATPFVTASVHWLTGDVQGWTLGALIGLRALAMLQQLVHSLPGRLRRVRERYWRWTFGAQAFVTFAPHLVFGAHWAAGGWLAGSALLLFPAPMSWVVLALVVFAEGVIQLAAGTSLVLTFALVVDGALIIALATYVVTRLVDVLAELRDTRAATAEAVVGQERLRAAREVFARLGERLSTTALAADAAGSIAGSNAAAASTSAAELGHIARRTLGEVRDAAQTFRNADDRPARSVPFATSTEPRLAFVVIAVMSLTGALANFFGIIDNQKPGLVAVVAAGAGLAALVGLQIHHAAPRVPIGVPPRGLVSTLPLQIMLVYVPVLVYGLNWIGMSVYLAACVLVVLRPPISWLVFAAITAAVPPIFGALDGRSWFRSSPLANGLLDLMTAYVWTVIVFRTPMLLATAVVRLRAARVELARMMLVRERLAVARDVHDLLGSSLSAVALKADLAQRLLPGDPESARMELADAARLAHRAIAEAQSLSGDPPDTTLAQELASARSMLAAASIRADITPCPGGLSTRADTALAIVVREAVTNVLRHSAARQCTISLSLDDDTATLHILNDGAAAPRTGSGTGIGNLRARVSAVGGQLSAAPRGEQGFSLQAEVPIA